MEVLGTTEAGGESVSASAESNTDAVEVQPLSMATKQDAPTRKVAVCSFMIDGTSFANTTWHRHKSRGFFTDHIRLDCVPVVFTEP
ncbi:hypothetical protein B7R25_11710 [Subtercola boreus]|uniref:Uncharacterized protein n=1 Tax=Subtercola boreus TaxID=120213 RepID=A0A3E0W9R0_9MICO|nr:hypothetical protein B7R24_11610 [Subtercola boreus]RFA19555.1 hypothetical protein B7R23_11590 [Subtercola boreus]RFA25921.1 hypothetical protein B7R25_11710 [Subtercola boreus]